MQLAVRLGHHTAVVGEVGGGTRQEQLALGETPNLAARLQGLAAPNTLVISAATWQLLRGFLPATATRHPTPQGFRAVAGGLPGAGGARRSSSTWAAPA